MENYDNKIPTDVWSERVYIETKEYVIRGTVYMPKVGKKNRLLTEILNTNKQFLAVTDCDIESKLTPQRPVEHYKFLEVNLSTVLIMRPVEQS
ncbi:hypothetical protein IKQ21_07810 [bacterium]|nr:hypothetical protein [bacterium]